MASTPASTANSASSGVIIPFNIKGNFVEFTNSFISSKFLGSTGFPFIAKVIRPAASISTPTAKAPAFSAIFIFSITTSFFQGFINIIPCPLYSSITSKLVAKHKSTAVSPTIGYIPESKHPLTTPSIYSLSLTFPPIFNIVPVIGAAKSGNSIFLPKISIFVVGFLAS